MSPATFKRTTSTIALGLALSIAMPASGYSVLTHEAIIDTAWEDTMKPLIRARFPDITDPALLEAHAYAYGGAIIQDMGYYPFSSKLFSDLVHYVRSGDFVTALIRDAKDPNQFAFALGALAHYTADNDGHPIAINRTVPIMYNKLRRKFGDSVTYEDKPSAHLKVEFGFDVLEVAKQHYAPKSYHDFIGFQVSKPVLEQAFEETYGIPLKAVFKDLDLALGTFRVTVSGLIPEATRAAWAAKQDEIRKSIPGATRRTFVYNLSRASYEKEWGRTYQRPGLGARLLAFVIRIVPKIGPFQVLAFRVPPPQSETLFMKSFNETLVQYRTLARETDLRKLHLPDRNLDTGQPVREGTYHLADRAYSELLEKLEKRKATVPPELRASIVNFYREPNRYLSKKAQDELAVLQSAQN